VVRRRTKLLMSSPAAISSTTVTAISTVSRVLRGALRLTLPLAPRDDNCRVANTAFTCGRDGRQKAAQQRGCEDQPARKSNDGPVHVDALRAGQVFPCARQPPSRGDR